MRKKKLKKYYSYNDIKKDNKVIVAININDFNQLSDEEKSKYQLVMMTNKERVIRPEPPDITDRELLLMILDKVTKLETRLDNIVIKNKLKE